MMKWSSYLRHSSSMSGVPGSLRKLVHDVPQSGLQSCSAPKLCPISCAVMACRATMLRTLLPELVEVKAALLNPPAQLVPRKPLPTTLPKLTCVKRWFRHTSLPF